MFRRLDREGFERALGGWLKTHGLKPGEAVAVDGKMLRGIQGEQVPGGHLLAAYAHETGTVVGQSFRGRMGDKRNELEALPFG